MVLRKQPKYQYTPVLVDQFNREDKVDPQQESFIDLKPTSAKEVPVIVKIGAVSIELHSGFHAETLREVIAAICSS